MKLLNILMSISMLMLVSCSEEKNPAAQYGNSLVESYKNTQKFDNKLNVQQVQKSIQEFYAANGRYPSDLNELTAFNGISLKSENYDYNSLTGNITEKK